ncbi:MAG: carbon storage regulator CsrA [Lachnospiraceae bacterium]|nr:carbon storage regulator CsrA [Lachnospiraceae bacterium]MCR5776859.1 carbon storage regulator CsrA [Lachnospiraceae bacterium]
MLTLSRKKGESLIINNNIEVTVLEVRGDQIKLGIAAPREVPIYRKEIYLEIQESNKNSMNVEAVDALKNLI